MPVIKKVMAVKGLTGFYYDDQLAIKQNAVRDGSTYSGTIKTNGFTAVRQPGESILLTIILDNGLVARGDCVAVQYSGTSGRDPLFLYKDYITLINNKIAPMLIGKEVNNFIELADMIDKININGSNLHTAIRYGFTQVLLDAVAKAKKLTRTEVIADEYNIELKPVSIPIFCQTGDERYDNVDKIIIKKADVLPHGLINNVNSKLGRNGEKLLEYIKWLKKRILKVGEKDYTPIFHLDVYGTIGQIYNNDIERMISYFADLEKVASPYLLRIEEPVCLESKEEQLKIMYNLRERLAAENINIKIVADEWCNNLDDIKEFVDADAADMIQVKTPDLGGINNTISAILYCKKNGVGAYLGGSCNETDLSARICADIAIATRPDQILAKPGMGVDEGLMIIYNQMNYMLSLLRFKGYS